MLPTAHFLLEDPDEVKRLIRENPWATFVSPTSAGLVASHYPVLLEEDAAGISVVSHFGRPDEVAHELGRHEILLIIQGPHGYVSPGWYQNGEFIPTWNHVTAHLYGVPELLDADENFRILGDLVEHFERRMPHPQRLEQNEAVARAVARGTVGLRLRVTRFEARRKLSQNKTPEVLERITTALESDDQYAEPRLAREMRRTGHADH